ncbi:hypothetical protein [Nonomuraea maheshkhaliensis]|uniref:hypothetical protein n=1 Tax=Nonomuraea maheshkhaliensis TaxID=419590 RepID=UPI0031FA384A
MPATLDLQGFPGDVEQEKRSLARVRLHRPMVQSPAHPDELPADVHVPLGEVHIHQAEPESLTAPRALRTT